ncbi:hypothetical protein CEXT_168051 [Caerostris extrusa]|uniref:Uncharacterized protein n=1 Tax=Caerostris extrusa TaxID=172846 RepID=A0AAV4N3W4_CAEEX|nr:hypothetical protein CEXT_168051 [Caerostris extrusa]
MLLPYNVGHPSYSRIHSKLVPLKRRRVSATDYSFYDVISISGGLYSSALPGFFPPFIVSGNRIRCCHRRYRNAIVFLSSSSGAKKE